MIRFCKAALPLAAAVILLAQGIARADFTTEATLLSVSEVPPHNTPAMGFATVTYSSLLNTLNYNITFSDLSSPAVAAHIHFGSATVSGPVILPFTGVPNLTSGSFSGALTAANLLPNPGAGINTFADAISAIDAGNAYVNIHDSLFPGGEIRGQLKVVAIPEANSVGLLAAALAAPCLGFVARKRSGS